MRRHPFDVFSFTFGLWFLSLVWMFAFNLSLSLVGATIFLSIGVGILLSLIAKVRRTRKV